MVGFVSAFLRENFLKNRIARGKGWCTYCAAVLAITALNSIEVGESFFTNSNCTILDADRMFIGDNVLLVVNVSFYTVGHLFDVDLRNQVREEIKPVVIGHRRATQRWCVKIIDAGRVTCQEYVDGVYVDLKK